MKKDILHHTVSGFKNNDQTILARVYKLVYPKVRAHIVNNNGSEAEAKDIFQEAFIACWKNIKDNKVMEDSNVEAYLFAIARNKWIDYLRSANFKKTISIGSLNKSFQDHGAEVMHDESEMHRNSMLEALRRLNENCRRILNLYYFERLSMKQIATQLDIDPASARNKKYRCMEQLRSLTLKSYNNEQDF